MFSTDYDTSCKHRINLICIAHLCSNCQMIISNDVSAAHFTCFILQQDQAEPMLI